MIMRLARGAGATSASAVEPLSQREHHWMRAAIRVGSALIRIASPVRWSYLGDGGVCEHGAHSSILLGATT